MLPPVTSWVVPSFLRRTTLPVTSFFLPFLPQPPAATARTVRPSARRQGSEEQHGVCVLLIVVLGEICWGWLKPEGKFPTPQGPGTVSFCRLSRKHRWLASGFRRVRKRLLPPRPRGGREGFAFWAASALTSRTRGYRRRRG